MTRYFLAIAIAGLATQLHAQNAENGLTLAQKWCNSCHSIGDAEPRMEDAGPLWEELAEKDTEYLVAAINRPHDFMPEFPALSDQDKEDIIAYILSLDDH